MKIHKIKLSKNQRIRANEFSSLVNNNLVPMNCLLCDAHNSELEVFSNKDRYDFIYPSAICGLCGNMQQAEYYSDKHLRIFYEDYYRDIYGGLSPSELFDHQYDRSLAVYNFCNDFIKPSNGSVFEIGTGSGGILAKFQDNGFNVCGIDLDERYMSFARKKGLSITYGDINSIEIKNKNGLVIICHVLEHIKNPKEFLKTVIEHMNEDGYIFIEVPIVELVLDGAYRGLIGRYLQNAHVTHFSQHSLQALVEQVGLEIVKKDRDGRFLVKKSKTLEVTSPASILESQKTTLDKLISFQKSYYLSNPIKSCIYLIYDLLKPLKKIINLK